MPSISLVAQETANSLCSNSCSGSAGTRLRLSAEEEAAAEESLSVYCKPVELYNIIHHRAHEKPLYLQRCMRYKLEEKHKKRIQLTVSLYVSLDHGLQIESLFPLYVMLVKPTSNSSKPEQSARYRFKRCFTLSTYAGDEGPNRFTAKFVLPERNKLSAEIEGGSLAILFISCVGGGHLDFASFEPQGGQCLLGKTPLEILDLSGGRSPNLGEGSETILSVDLRPFVIETSCEDRKKFISLQAAPTPAIMASMQRLEVIFTAENFGAKDQLPYELYSYGDIASCSLPHITRLKNGDVVFNYMYYNNKLQRTEVTEDFSCPFCLEKCASFKGLKCHLFSSHDLFKFEFRANEGYHSVNVYVKGTEPSVPHSPSSQQALASSIAAPSSRRYSSCNGDGALVCSSKPRRRRKPKSIIPSGNRVQPRVLEPDASMVANAIVLESDLPMSTNEARDGIDSPNSAFSESVHGASPDGNSRRDSGVIQSGNTESIVPVRGSSVTIFATNQITESVDGGMSGQGSRRSSQAIVPSEDIESTVVLPGSNGMAVTTLQLAVVQKRPVDRNARIHAQVLQRRRFYHSHRAQAMEMEEILSGWDSEDELDHDVSDLQDRRMLDDFVDVTNDEKQMMHMWNSFVRRRRVLADAHIPWACENFSRLHAAYLVKTPSLLWCWRIFMIKLWKHGLLNDRAIDNCNQIIKQFPTQQNNNAFLIKSDDNNAAE